MTDLLTPPVQGTQTPLATEQEAREVAEAAREKEWQAPSFVRELFEGSFRLDLVHPYPPARSGRPGPRQAVHGEARALHAGAGGQRQDRPRRKDPARGREGTGGDRRLRHQDPERVRRSRSEPVQLHPCDRTGDQPGRQPHRPALRRAVDRRSDPAQAVRHAGAEEEVSAPPSPGCGVGLRADREPRRLRPGGARAPPPRSPRTASTTSSTARSSGAPTAPSPS